MKTIHGIIGAVMLSVLFACQKDALPTWSGTNDIYFENSVVMDAASRQTDSLKVLFIFAPQGTKDSVLKIAVKTMGAPVAYDRTFKVSTDQSTAVPGKHYDALPDSFVMRANRVVDTIRLRLVRTPDMLTDTVSLVLQLKPNHHFTTNMTRVAIGNNTYLSTTTLRIRMTDVLSQPDLWYFAVFGKFSRKKFLLVCALTGYDPAKLANESIIADTYYLGKVTQRYLDEQAKAGNIILDDDGSVMTMGTSITGG
ncbi:DUF4843 domain-containing protein [Chitinophaga varians]|uniref:DUF4843 domain-containing protein n=1 Tax=Chitinophaga varians TaxID=2202339 RepID=UPI00165F379C|nr:DUF4843 domain-containing protein [Chitinophaga varians]MBC9911647.1 DUF4843 domain-containing protein [Chitinophaga varians]